MGAKRPKSLVSEITDVNNSQLSIENILTNINWCLVDLTYMRKVSRVD